MSLADCRCGFRLDGPDDIDPRCPLHGELIACSNCGAGRWRGEPCGSCGAHPFTPGPCTTCGGEEDHSIHVPRGT